MTIDAKGNQQEQMFAISHEERNALQEQLHDLLDTISKEETTAKMAAAVARGKIAELKKKAMKLEELLR
jgi:hypothetical protein